MQTAYFDWPATLARYLQTYRPQLVVVMLGGNDCQSFYSGPQLLEPGTAAFDRVYSSRVGAFMSEATAAKARVLWVGMPIMQDPAFSSCMVELDADYRSQAATRPGVTYFSSWQLFEAPHGGYTEYLEVAGHEIEVRDADGVHIDPPGGTDLIGRAVVGAIEATYRIHL